MSEQLTELWHGRYNVTITPMEGIRGHKNVSLFLFREYDDMSKTEATYLLRECGFDYDPYLASYVEQTFSLDEMLELVKYFAIAGPEVEIEVSKAYKPVENIMGVSAMAVGGPNDIIELWQHDDYYLPFKVDGYYDLRAPGVDPPMTEEEGLSSLITVDKPLSEETHKQDLVTVLKAFWAAVGHDADRMAKELPATEFLSQYFTMDSPEVQAVMAGEA